MVMGTMFVVVHLVICIFLVFVILLQPGKGDGGVAFGSSSQTIFGSRGAGNFLTKTTSVCAVLFLFTSFVLTRARMKEHSTSVIHADTPAATSAPVAPGAPAGTPEPAKPAAEAPKK